MTATFSWRESEVFSPTVPQTMRPDTPSRIERVDDARGRLDVEAVILPELGRDRREHALPPDSRRHRLKPPVSGRIVAAGDAGAKPSCRLAAYPHEIAGAAHLSRTGEVELREAQPGEGSALRGGACSAFYPAAGPSTLPLSRSWERSRHLKAPPGCAADRGRLLGTARNPSPGRLRRLDLSLRGEVRACAIVGEARARLSRPFGRG